ncbi:nicotinamidase-related amidase [Nocardiopsis sp. Huas11]|uniref:isochorismatase family protein n=1 Tax=Nocardiopsis sp. Huas11 TaxID=2183912 RepID=UPI000EB58FDA|nr:isochorismatase family protein [Nocardiopsis sp. Huas11]RKS05108.1 nicotinamidase-related amidase [Nocardiopsis sp. Huas11]
MTTALLVIDAQRSFLQRESWSAASDPEIADTIARLVEHHRDRGDHIVWVLHTQPGSGTVFDPARGFVELMEGLSPAEGEPVRTKTVHNAFTGTDLSEVLADWGVDEVTVCGVRTEQCCETTARVASDLGLRVTFAVDATATEPIEAPGSPAGRSVAEILADPRTLLPEDIITRTVYALSGRFADVRTVAEIIG